MIVLSLAAACLGPLAAEPPKGPGLETLRLQLKWQHQFQFAGYYMAEALGYYRAAGLDVQFVEGRSDMDFADEVLSGRCQFGVDSSDVLIDRVRGRKVVVLAAIFQHSPQIILSLASSGIRSPADLVGKRVMVSSDAEAEIFSMLKSESLSASELRLVPHSWNLEDLVSGKVDAVSAYSTNEPLVLKERGIASVMMRPLTYGIDFYGDCLISSEREVKDHPARTAAFLRASLEGWDYAMSHVSETVDLILAKYHPGKTRAELELEARAMDELIMSKLVPIGFMNPGRWKHIGDTYASLGIIPANYKLDGFLYDPLPHRDDRLVWALLLALLGGCAAALGYIVILRNFNRRLAREVNQRTLRLESLNAELEGEVRERRAKEGELAASLSEKEILLREIHHRVKNNLQIIASLVSLHLDEVTLSEIAAPLHSIRDRIYSMALIHEHLYGGRDLSSIDMDNYLQTLTGQIVDSYCRPGLRVQALVQARQLRLPMEKAIPIGLIVGELAANSMKYAFEGREEGRIDVALFCSEDRCSLIVGDDGKGPAPVQTEGRRGIGLQLVEALAVQLGGRYETRGGKGWTTRIYFPSPQPPRSRPEPEPQGLPPLTT